MQPVDTALSKVSPPPSTQATESLREAVASQPTMASAAEEVAAAAANNPELRRALMLGIPVAGLGAAGLYAMGGSEKTSKAKKPKGTATKRDPKKWAAAKARAKAKMGGKWSARAAQLAVKYYKDSGGRYKGKKPTAKNNKLKKWTKQDWQWSGERKKEGSMTYASDLKKLAAAKSLASEAAKNRLRVAILSGSTGNDPEELSRSRALAETYRDYLESQGAEVDWMDMRDMGDMPDTYDWDTDWYDDYKKRLTDADAMVLSTPVFNYGPSGRVMQFLHRTLDKENQQYKPYALLSGAGTPRSALALGGLANQLDTEIKGIGIGGGVQVAGDEFNVETGEMDPGIVSRANENAAKLLQVARAMRSKQDLTTKEAKSKGVYLPAKSIDALKSSKKGRNKLKAAIRKKNKATREGEQHADHGLHKGKKRSKLGD